MPAITIATANIYWFGLGPQEPTAIKFQIPFFHNAADDARLATLLSRLGADLLCFQEIVDVARFERVLAQANPALSLRDAAGQAVASSPVSSEAGKTSGTQHTLLVWNTQTLKLLDWHRMPDWKLRPPVVANFTHMASGRRLRAVGVHLKSSALDVDDKAGQQKREQLAALARWVSAETAAGRIDDTLILGDFNATLTGTDAGFLKQGALAQWSLRQARDDQGSNWTTLTDLDVIDHILLSPALAAAGLPDAQAVPEIVCFDRDPGVPDGAQPGKYQLLKQLTDHRPVRLSLELRP